MEYAYGYCGMPCALCTRYRTEGKSRCPGCSADGYYTDVCRVYRCCRGKGNKHCGLCGEYPCARLGNMGDFSDLYTNNVKQRTGAAVKAEGFAAWYGEYAQRVKLLTEALEKYNNGRMKRYICELFITREMSGLRELMERATALTGDIKEKGKGFRAIAEEIFGDKEGVTDKNG